MIAALAAALRVRLVGDSTLVGLVGAGGIVFEDRSQGVEPPCAVFRVVELGRFGIGGDKFAATVELVSLSSSVQLSESIDAAARAWVGSLTGSVNGVAFHSVAWQSHPPVETVGPADGDDVQDVRIVSTFDLVFSVP